MFLPLHDKNPLKVIRFQAVSGLIIVLNFLVFIFTYYGLGAEQVNQVALSWGTVPAVLTNHAQLPPHLDYVPEAATLVTYMFLHAGWLHIISNMAFIWVFADNVEDAFGHVGFLVFFIFCGAIAALAHTAMSPESQAPLIGASGAVSGTIAAYLVLFPKARVWVLLFMKIPLPIPALIALVGWFGFQIINLFVEQNGEVIVAWWAHIGGFLAGLAIAFALKRRLHRRLAVNDVPPNAS